MLLEKGFYKWEDYIDQAYLDLCDTDRGKCCDYPIPYLNDALLGIMKSELVLIGADSGCGKTEIANQIAFHNASKGKNVYLFSLEGDIYEVAQRERYRHFANMVITAGLHIDLDYRKFIMNEYQGLFKSIGKDFHDEMMSLDDFIKAKYKTLHIFKRSIKLTKEVMRDYLDIVKEDADLVIVDHLHYFEFLTSNEYSEVSEIMKVIKKKQDEIRVPVILISHLRKKNKDRVFPDNEDFHGSSNIYKQANTCLLFSHVVKSENKDTEYQNQIQDGLYQTGIRITKCRTGMPNRLIGISVFDNREKKYQDGYKMAISYDHDIVDLPEDKYPRWAKRTATPKEVYGGKYD